jgi:molybdenum cofactor cytidylyltransferase
MGADKLLLPVQGEPMLRRVARAMNEAGLSPLVIVLSPEGTTRAQVIADLEAEIVVNEAHQEGMASSIRAGIRALQGRAEAVAITPGDLPLMEDASIRKVATAFEESPKGIAVAVHEGAFGHPVIFDLSRYEKDLLALHGDRGGRAVVLAHPADVLEVSVGQGSTIDIDTAAEYEALQTSLQGDTPCRVLFVGPGSAERALKTLWRHPLRLVTVESSDPEELRWIEERAAEGGYVSRLTTRLGQPGVIREGDGCVDEIIASLPEVSPHMAREFARVLRPGGTLHGGDLQHDALRDAGFTPQSGEDRAWRRN